MSKHYVRCAYGLIISLSSFYTVKGQTPFNRYSLYRKGSNSPLIYHEGGTDTALCVDVSSALYRKGGYSLPQSPYNRRPHSGTHVLPQAVCPLNPLPQRGLQPPPVLSSLYYRKGGVSRLHFVERIARNRNSTAIKIRSYICLFRLICVLKSSNIFSIMALRKLP